MSHLPINRSLPTTFLALCALMALSSVVNATLIVQGYTPQKHDRFYTGADKAFIGEAFDWSGVGRSTSWWCTMISPTYFLSANHAHNTSGPVTFYPGNTTSNPQTYTIDSSFGRAVGPDLWLGRLTAPIPTSANIAYYPIQKLASNSNYLGETIYVYGLTNRIGRNVVSSIENSYYMNFNYDTYGQGDSLGIDEAFLQGGDSGGPSFTAVNGSLALLGTHRGISPSGQEWSQDNFAPPLIALLNAFMGMGSDEQITIVGANITAPEPGTWAMLLVAGMAASLTYVRRRRK